jgi:hypothetical protein
MLEFFEVNPAGQEIMTWDQNDILQEKSDVRAGKKVLMNLTGHKSPLGSFKSKPVAIPDEGLRVGPSYDANKKVVKPKRKGPGGGFTKRHGVVPLRASLEQYRNSCQLQENSVFSTAFSGVNGVRVQETPVLGLDALPSISTNPDTLKQQQRHFEAQVSLHKDSASNNVATKQHSIDSMLVSVPRGYNDAQSSSRKPSENRDLMHIKSF